MSQKTIEKLKAVEAAKQQNGYPTRQPAFQKKVQISFDSKQEVSFDPKVSKNNEARCSHGHSHGGSEQSDDELLPKTRPQTEEKQETTSSNFIQIDTNIRINENDQKSKYDRPSSNFKFQPHEILDVKQFDANINFGKLDGKMSRFLSMSFPHFKKIILN